VPALTITSGLNLRTCAAARCALSTSKTPQLVVNPRRPTEPFNPLSEYSGATEPIRVVVTEESHKASPRYAAGSLRPRHH
jgi:hypothetical protein